MKLNSIAVIGILIIALIMGCSGNYGTLKYQTESESKLTKQKLIENWSDYNIQLVYLTRYNPPRLTAINFHPKNDNRKLTLDGIGSKVEVKDQETWAEVVKENSTSDGELALTWSWDQVGSSTGVQEKWGPDNQLYAFEWWEFQPVVRKLEDNLISVVPKVYAGNNRGAP